MAFSIRFLDAAEAAGLRDRTLRPSQVRDLARYHGLRPADVRSAHGEWGRIVIGDFRDTFYAPFDVWSAADYRNQWRLGVRRIVDGASSSCLVSGLYDPQASEFLVWWMLWNERGLVYIQNALRFYRDLPSEFDAKDPYAHVGDHHAVTAEGERISEWTAALSDLGRFLGDSQAR
jgi:hypothetical protein